MGHTSNIAKMEFREDDRASVILEKLRLQRLDGKYCDMVLTVEGRTFKAHRNVLAACSPYFDAMCNSGFEEEKQNMATIECVSADAMEQILDYMYTGQISITSENVDVILQGADPFLMSQLKEYCYRFLTQNMDASNCFVVRHLADLYGFIDLYERSKKFIRNQFMQVAQNSMEDIVRLNFAEILEIIKDEDIRVEKEEMVYEIVIAWVNFDVESRRRCLLELLGHVRLPQLNRNYLINVVEKEPLVSENEECLKLYMDAKHQTDTTRHSYCSDSPVLKPRKGRLQDVVIITGGISEQGPMSECFGYVMEENRWTPLPALPVELRFHAAAELNGCMYVVGGSSNGLVTNSVHVYDPNVNSWRCAANLPDPIEYLSLVACNGYLYALGGIRWERVQQTVYEYDQDLDQWKKVSDMPTPKYNMQVATIDNRYIITIAGRDRHRRPVKLVERYDTYTGEWSSLTPIPLEEGTCWDLPVVEAFHGKIHVTDLATRQFCLDPDKDNWTEVACQFCRLPERTCFQYCCMNRNVFIFGGWGTERSINSPISDACIFNQDLNLWTNISSPPASTLASACCFLQIPYEFLLNNDNQESSTRSCSASVKKA